MKCCENCVCNPEFINNYFENTKNPSKDYMQYLIKAKDNFDDYFLRQINFVFAKLSIRKYFPEKSYIIESYKSEQMSIKELDNIITKLLNQGNKHG